MKMILISELRVLCDKFDDRLKQKEKVEKIFNLIRKDIKENDSLKIEDYIKITDNIIDNPYYIEQLHYKLKELGDSAEEAFIKLNELLKRKGLHLKN